MRRGVLASAAVLVTAAVAMFESAAAHPARPARAAATLPVLAVASSYSGTVDLIDARTLRRLGRPLDVIPDGSTPRDPRQAAIYPALIANRGEHNYAQEVVLSPNGETLYVSRGYLGDVAAFSLRTRRELWRLQLPQVRADHLALSRDGRRLFAGSLPGDRVYAIDTRIRRIVGSYAAGTWPHVLELSPDGRYVYSGSLGNQLAPYGSPAGQQKLTVADARTLRVVRRYTFKAGVRPFAFVPRTHRLVLQLSYFNGFVEIDLRTGRTVRTVPLPLSAAARRLSPRDYPNQAAHHGIAVSPSGQTVCDAATISDYVALVRLAQPRRRRLIPVGQAPSEAITSLDGHFCFVTSRGPTALRRGRVRHGDSVSVISYRRGREVRRLRVGIHPQAETVGEVPLSALRAGGFVR